MNITEVVIFCIYFLAMLGIGLYFFLKSKDGNAKTYFLGNRAMGPWVTALSAGASDMSAWVLMALPTSIYALGLGQVWIPVGLAIGYALSWIIEAKRLRKFSIVAKDSITVPQYLTNRFLSSSKVLQVICAIVFLVAYTVYAASAIKACGTLFHTILGVDTRISMVIAAIIIVGYTFLGGYSAVCWTDFFQGLLVLGAMFIAPIFAATMVDFSAVSDIGDASFWNPVRSVPEIISGLAWGLGYFGMPHIIVRFMSLKSQKEVKKSATIGITWTVLIVIFAALIGLVGRLFLGYEENIADKSLVFISMVRKIFPSLISGVLLCAVLAASMSTADSQLLAASSAFTADVYQPVIRRGKASDKETLWVGRVIVIIISIAALFVALDPNGGSIMDLVENAWGLFGAAFGPVILLSLFWKRFNWAGAVSGIVAGSVADIGFLILFKDATGIYEILPGFIIAAIVAVVVSLLTKKPSAAVEKLYDDAVNYED